jgi:putative flippase GtrA
MPRVGGPASHVDHLWTLTRFALVGAANTAVGLAVIAGLDLGLGVDPHLANAGGYVVGVAVGFALNRGFVFRSDGHLGRTGARYLAAVVMAFAANQLVLAGALHLYSGMALGRLAAQATAMASYTALLFGLCRLWVFRSGPAPSSGAGS